MVRWLNDDCNYLFSFTNLAQFGYDKKFDSKDDLHAIIATGHNKEYGKVVTYGKSQGFKIAKVSKAGSKNGSASGYGKASDAEAAGHNAGYKKGIAAGGAAAAGVKAGAGLSASGFNANSKAASVASVKEEDQLSEFR